MQYPAAFQIFVAVERQSKKHRSRSVIRQCQSGSPRGTQDFYRNMLMSRGGTPQPRLTEPFRTMPRRHFLHWFEVR